MTAQREDRREDRRQAGMSALEVLMMGAIMSVLMVMITESMTTLSRARSEQRAGFRLIDVADQLARRIEADVDYAARVFCADPDGRAMLASMGLAAPLSPRDHLLPALTTNGYFAPDASTRETGNVLFLARRGPKALVRDSNREHLLETLVMVVYAPVADQDGIDLMRWCSDLLVNYWDVASIANPVRRAEVLAELHDNGVYYAWDPLAAAADSLWAITAGGELAMLATGDKLTGVEDARYSRMLRDRMIGIAENGAAIPHAVPRFAQPTGSFPGGFELKVDGSAAGKLLLLRMVTRSRQVITSSVANEVQRLVTTSG